MCPYVRVEGNGRAVVSQAGAVLLVESVRKTSLDLAMPQALAPCCKPRALHDLGKILLGLVLATALGGNCLADVAMLRSRTGALRAGGPRPDRLPSGRHARAACSRALVAIRATRAEVRVHVWRLAEPGAPHADRQVIVDIDGALVPAHSDKKDATRTSKKRYGHHPLLAFADHADSGTGEPVMGLLRVGRADSDADSERIETTRLTRRDLPPGLRRPPQAATPPRSTAATAS